MADGLSHLDERGQIRMVDVSAKPPQRRRAVAEGFFCARADTLDRLERHPDSTTTTVVNSASVPIPRRLDLFMTAIPVS